MQKIPRKNPLILSKKKEFKIFKNSFNKIRFEPVYLGDKQRIYCLVIHLKGFNLPLDK